jgi:hypothetical protein
MNEMKRDAGESSLTPEEWQDVLAGRARRAEEARLATHWAAVVADLSDAIGVGSDPDDPFADREPSDWDAVVERFCGRIEPHLTHISEDMISDFAPALMRFLGFRLQVIRGHGDCWVGG